MNEPTDFNQRKHERHDYREQVYFDFIYDFQAKVEFEPRPEDSAKDSPQRHEGITRNISTQGLCLTTDVPVAAHSFLDIHVYLQTRDEPVRLQGEVRWNKIIAVDQNGNKRFDVGVHLTGVNGKSVQDTIHFDENYHVYWSDVLELLLGEFRKYYQS